MSDISTVCFIGIYGQPQDDVLRAGFDDRDISLVEVTVPTRSFSEAWADRRLPIMTMRATMNYFGRFPRVLFPVLVFLTLCIHALATAVMLAYKFNRVRQADVVVVPHMGDTSVLFAKPLAFVLGVPLVYFSHNGLYFTLIRNRELFPETSVAAKTVYRLDEWSHRLSDRIIVFSEHSKERFVDEFALPARRYAVIYISVNEDEFQTEPASDQEMSCDVMYWGNFHPHHGPETMVQAANLLPATRFVMAGQSEKRDSVVTLAEELGVSNVSFPGFLSWQRLIAHIRETSVVLGPVADNPQTEFTIGTKVAEAAYLGKAIIVGRQPATTEVFTHGEDAYLVEPGDPESVADAVTTVLDDSELRSRLEDGSVEVYKTHFAGDVAVERFLCVSENARRSEQHS